MIDILNIQIDLQTAIITLPIGIIIGYMSNFLIAKKILEVEKRLSIAFVTIWVVLIIISFLTGKDVPNLFDFIGFGASGTLLGIDVTNKIEKAKDFFKK